MNPSSSDHVEKRGLLYKILALGFSYPKESQAFLLSSANYWADLNLLLEDVERENTPLSTLTKQAASAIQRESQESGLVGLEVEYNRLFQLSSTTPCALTASEYLAGEGRQALAVAQLRGLYKSFGLRIRLSKEADNLSVMLEFMSWLCAKELRAIETSHKENRQLCVRAQQIMLEDYLGWLPLLANTIQDSAVLTYYKWLSSCLCEFIKLERQTLLFTSTC